jgi:hypothetical protein
MKSLYSLAIKWFIKPYTIARKYILYAHRDTAILSYLATVDKQDRLTLRMQNNIMPLGPLDRKQEEQSLAALAHDTVTVIMIHRCVQTRTMVV